ncbi:hypothetical protein Fmac_025463 [Flemingia macrophylla]|uniref:non-specific serine/threonine protein kinase n=1 Tax=Flemingia macrophylla TaxID=520843 RepID=A0ABD1LU37_9FABA
MIMLSCVLVPFIEISVANKYSINMCQSMSDDGQTLVSTGGKFELGFFRPGSSHKRYLGIWYKNIATVVWVANRAKPINDSSGILKLDSAGNLILTQNGSLVWSTNSSKPAHNPVVVLLDSGNLVIKNETETEPEEFLWQSFDHPSDTALPGMKLGSDLRTGLQWRYTAWKSPDDPSPGDVYRVLELYNYPEIYLMNGTTKLFRYGPWNGEYFSGIPDRRSDTNIYDKNFVRNQDMVYYTFLQVTDNVFTRVVTNQTGYLYRYIWAKDGADEQNWKEYKTFPRVPCESYGLCGPYGNCVSTKSQSCHCLKGFRPKSPEAWNSFVWTQGCVRNKPLNCKDKLKEAFVKFERLKVPDTTHTWLNESIGLEECRIKCLNNCSCMAYTNSDIRGGGSGCAMWFGDLVDMQQYETGGQYLYIRMDASELESGGTMLGILVDGQKIAVKTLSRSSWQGVSELINEVKLIAKLQHRNLVKLLGYFIQGQEKMLIYEYMSNGSLDSLIFGNTSRVVGTYGYMAPEYALDGLFSTKSDVFSFGILVLEIICGKRNRGFYHIDKNVNLVSHAWTTWKVGKALELIDPTMKESCVIFEVLRFLHISLLCVQQYPEDRPTMASVNFMLNSHMELVEPKEHGFIPRNVMVEEDLRSSQKNKRSTNDVTISLLQAQ